MRVLEAKATKEAERKLSRKSLQEEEEEEQLMEEKKKRKDDKRRKEAAQKKTAEHKNKASEPAKPSVSQTLPVAPTAANSLPAPNSSSGNNNNNNAKRSLGISQQQQPPQQPLLAQPPSLPRYPAREVPPRFRHQEQKQLLKRGQPLPWIAVNLGPASKPLSSTVTNEQTAVGDETQSGNRKQPDANHNTLRFHYESSPWGTASSNSDSSINWDTGVVDASDKEAWLSVATGSDSELAKKVDAENDPLIMASGPRNGPQSKFGGNNGNGMGKGSLGRSSWGQSLGSLMSTCPVSADIPNGPADSSRADAWGTLASPNGEPNPSTSNANGYRSTWPLLENSEPALKGSGGGSVGPMANPQSLNPADLGGSWGNGLTENSDSQANGTRRALRGSQPQNLIPEANGPNNNNNTTNFAISSLPNLASSMQASDLASHSNNNHTGPGSWGAAGAKSSWPQATSVINGASSGGSNEAKIGSLPATAALWVGACSHYSGEACLDSSSQANSNTVNATLLMPPQPQKADAGGEKGTGAWEAVGMGSPQSAPWEHGPTGGGGTRASMDGGWHQLPSNQCASESLGANGKKFTNTWKSVKEEKNASTTVPNFPMMGQNGGGSWAKGSAGGSSEDSSEDKPSGEGTSRERWKADPQALLQSIVSRVDLDPRVLSNAGWGQTPIRQNTSWETELSPRGEKRANNGTEAWRSCSAAAVERPTPNGSRWGEPKPATRWGGDPKGGWGEERPRTAPGKDIQSWDGGGKEERSSSWSEMEKLKQGWGDGLKGAHSPAIEGWGENSRSNHWGEMRKSSSGSSDNSDRSTASGWKGAGKGGGGGTHWGNGGGNGDPMARPSHSSGWEESAKLSQSQGWVAEPPKASQAQGWGEPPKAPESPEWGKAQDTAGRWGPPEANAAIGKPPGWMGAPLMEEEPTGWEEPSPESIRRKIEIDDGTSAWGDPSKYNYKSVNMWNKNTLHNGERLSEQQAQQLQHQGVPLHGAGPISENGSSGGGGGNSSGSGRRETAPPPATVDNGTSAWGKPVDTRSSWVESMGDAMGSSSWGNTSLGRQASNKSGPKTMHVPDGWCGGSMPSAGSHQSGWEEEDDVEIGTWNSYSVQDPSISVPWPPSSRKLPSKGTMKNGNKQEDAWMNPFVKQFANLGFPRESPEEIMQSNKMEITGGILPDKWMEMEKHNLNVAEYSRVIGKGPHSRPQNSKESSMDQNPYFDKDGLLVAADDPPNVQFLPGQTAKFPPSNSALLNQALGSLSAQSLNPVRQNGNPSGPFGGLAAQPRSLLPDPAQPPHGASQLNPRTQVPPPLLSPQVPVSLLKYAPNNGSLNPLFGPQQVAMLNQLTQLNQISQLQQLLAQQKKVQNHRNMLSGGSQQQEQQSCYLNMQQQQMMQQPCPLDPNLLLKQQQLHSTAMKSFLESVVPHGNAELQKGSLQMSAFSNFPIGSNSNLNVNMDMGNIKEPQSRLRKWTTVDSVSTNVSPLDQNASKNGAISGGFRLEEASFVPYDFMNGSNSLASPPGPIGEGWSRAKSPSGSSSVNWPPEFRPGEPWKGYPNIDPETDPYITPGSVTNNLSINTVREADHLRDRNGGSSSSLNTALPSTSAWSSIRASNYNVSLSSTAQSTSSARNSDSSKPTWSTASANGSSSSTSLAHELWKVPLPPKSVAAPSRPPPGLTGQKGPLSSWENPLQRFGGGGGGAGWSTSEGRYTPGSAWGESSGRITNCLVLKNLTPQIDGSTLRTLCMQHGPLKTFHLNLPHGNALVRYSSKEEVMKAQTSLHMCVLGNTTILAEFASEEEISRFFAQGPSLGSSPAWPPQGHLGASSGDNGASHAFPGRSDTSTHWNGAGDLHGGAGSSSNSSSVGSSSLGGRLSYSSGLWGSLGGGGRARALMGGPSSALSAFL
ncbi:trinucleotide repeat-containing gene 6A protein-like isoform X6 [Anolis sagrei]|uniref:trinucleotide repeat-containing gene 6A protein-like isoform X6 n=1 Tax=Anolis sagrei TaxID=38937 RepID=UPI003522BB32